jgi:hypothetical protein
VALRASGLLSEKIGGPSVFPPQPEGIWTQHYSQEKWTPSQGEDRYRRGIYTFGAALLPIRHFSHSMPLAASLALHASADEHTVAGFNNLNDPRFSKQPSIWLCES